jgi:hypothetical protein
VTNPNHQTNSASQNCQTSTAALREELRGQFLLIAQCAAEDSGNTNDECAVAAMLMADLLSVAAMFQEHAVTCERADEIVAFCQQQALPILADAGTEDSSDADAGRSDEPMERRPSIAVADRALFDANVRQLGRQRRESLG